MDSREPIQSVDFTNLDLKVVSIDPLIQARAYQESTGYKTTTREHNGKTVYDIETSSGAVVSLPALPDGNAGRDMSKDPRVLRRNKKE